MILKKKNCNVGYLSIKTCDVLSAPQKDQKTKVKMLEKRILIVCFILSFGNVISLLSVADIIILAHLIKNKYIQCFGQGQKYWSDPVVLTLLF